MKVRYQEFDIELRYIGGKQAPWTSEENRNYNKIKVTNNNTGNSIEFGHWIHKNNRCTESEMPIDALAEFICRALAGEVSYEEFCSEYQYEYDSEYSEIRYKGNKESLTKLNYLHDKDHEQLLRGLEDALSGGIYR